MSGSMPRTGPSPSRSVTVPERRVHEQGGLVAGAHPGHRVIPDLEQVERHEPLDVAQVDGQVPVHVGHHLAEAPGARGPHPQAGAGRRHEQGGGGPVPRHVPDGDPESAPRELVAGQEVEVVAAHGVAGDHPARHLEAGEGR